MISFDPPPNGFSTGEFYSAPLRVYHTGWEGNNRLWIYDQKGFLCSTDDPADLIELLVRQSERPNREAPYGAREAIRPEAFTARLELQARMDASHEVAREAIRSTPGFQPLRPKGSQPKLTGLSLEDLGL